MRVLWDILFSLFGTTWVMSGEVRDVLLSWKVPLLAKDGRKCSKQLLFVCYRQCRRLEIELFFGMIFCLYKSSNFLFRSEMKLSMENGPMTLVGFIDWVGCE